MLFGPGLKYCKLKFKFTKNQPYPNGQKGVQNAIQEECNYLAKVLEFVLNIFRYLCFRIGQSQNRVSYKNVAYEKIKFTNLSY